MTEENLKKLEQRVTDMIKVVEDMGHENKILQTDQAMLRQEIKALQEKNKIAKARVEQIIARLKSLEP